MKESATLRKVPEDVRHWLLAEGHHLDEADPLHMLWAGQAFGALSRCFANEIDTSGSKLTFKGPPKLNLTIPEAVGEPIEQAEGLFYQVSCRGIAMLGLAALGISIYAFVYSAPAPSTPMLVVPSPQASAPATPHSSASNPETQPQLKSQPGPAFQPHTSPQR